MPTTSNFGWTTPADTDLVKDGALAIRTLGNGIDTSMAELKGGTTGQILSKTSNTDMDFTWVTQDDANAIQNTIVDAKGDLIAATANDTPARLAVGNNGETLVADSSTSTGLRYTAGNAVNNPVLNSSFQIWQRGTSIAVASGSSTAYTADRWLCNRFATGSTVSRQATNDTTNLPNIQYCARVQRDSGNTSTAYIDMINAFETINTIPFVGKTVTLSFYGRKGANYSSASDALTFRLVTGTGTDQNPVVSYTSTTSPISSTATLTTTWQRFTATGTLATTANELFIDFYYTPSGTAGANDYFEFTGVQIDLGSVALPFRTYSATLAGELAACQRYYIRYGGNVVDEFLGWGQGNGSTQVYCRNPFPVTMRTTPTFGSAAIANFRVENGSTSTTSLTSVAISGATSKNAAAFNFTKTGATFTAGQSFASYTDNTLNGYLEWSAEL
jgi:hypothetical protein